MLAFSLSTLVLSASLASAAYVRPEARQAQASPTASSTCPSGSTDFQCPDGTYLIPAGESPDTLEDGRAYVECFPSPGLPTVQTSCYYATGQDWQLADYNPDGTYQDEYSDPECPRQATRVITCSPDGRDAYTCQAPQVTYSCPDGYMSSGTSGADFVCSGPQTCYYYSDSGRVDTLTPGMQSPDGCLAQAPQMGTCSNSMRRRNGVSTGPAWLRSRQAVIKRGVTAREANRARVARSYKPKP